MIAGVASTFADFASGLGLEAAKGHFDNKLDEKKLQKALKEFVERQSSYNEISSFYEDVDFQGLKEYIEKHFLDSVTAALFDPSPYVRIRKRNDIVASAISESGATSDEAKKRIEVCIRTCIDIVFAFYESQCDIEDYIVGVKVVDALGRKIDNSEKNIVDSLGEKVDKVKSEIVSQIENNNSVISVDRALALSEDGNIQAIGTDVQKMLEHISLEHPLYPDYGYDYQDGVVRSKALTNDAITKHPSKLVLTGVVRFGSSYFDNHSGDPFDYAYRHQIAMIMDVSKAVQYLGELKDPNQKDAERLVGSTVIATPPKFPPAFPCSIKIKDKTYFEYVLFRTQEIEDDGTYVIGNKEQNDTIYFEIRINPKKWDSQNYKVIIQNANNHELLKYTQFMYDLSKDKELHIYVLSAQEDLIAGNVNNFSLDTGFNDVEEELDFLKRICIIEDYFKVEIMIEDEIRHNDYKSVCQLSDLIIEKEVISSWSSFTFNKEVDQQLRDSIDSWENNEHSFALVTSCNSKIFETEITFDLMRIFKSVQITNFEKLKEKINVLDDGDIVKIFFQPGEDRTMIDTLRIPEEFIKQYKQ